MELDSASPVEAYSTLSRLSDNVLHLPRDEPEAPRPITLSVENAPFWQVVEALEALAPIQLEPSRVWQQAHVKWRGCRVGRHVAVAGPIRIRLQSCATKRELWQPMVENVRPWLQGSELALEILLEVEPRITVASASLLLTEVIDEDEADLLDGSWRERSRGHLSLGRPGVMMGTINGRASLPKATSKCLRRIRGKVRLRTMPELPPVRIAPLGPTDQVLQYGEHTLTFKGVTGDQVEGYVASFGSRRTLSREELKSLLRAKLSGTNGMVQPAATGNCQAKEGWPFCVRLHFSGVTGCDPRTLLVPQYAGSRIQEYDFELRDVPLPSQTALYPPDPDRRRMTVPGSRAAKAPKWMLPLEEMQGTTYTRTGGELPPAEFFADVSQQTGVKVWPLGLASKRLRRVGLEPVVVRPDYRQIGFWELLDDLSVRYRLLYTIMSGVYRREEKAPTIRVMRDRSPRTTNKGRHRCVRYFGPLRFSLERVGLQAGGSIRYRAERDETQDGVALHVSSRARLEPKVRVLRQGGAVVECRTNTGEDLVSMRTSDSLDAARYVRDPRCRRLIGTSEGLGVDLYDRFRLTPDRLPSRLARVRFYYFAEVYDEDAEFEIAEPSRPARYTLGDDFVLEWYGIVDGYGSREAQFAMGRPDGKSPMGYPHDVFRHMAVQNEAGERISGGISHHKNTNLCRLFLRAGAEPAKVRLWYPKGLRTYAGFVEFQDIPLLSLPRP